MGMGKACVCRSCSCRVAGLLTYVSGHSATQIEHRRLIFAPRDIEEREEDILLTFDVLFVIDSLRDTKHRITSLLRYAIHRDK